MVAVVMVAGTAHASSELFNINDLNRAQEAKLVSFVETQARLIFGEYFLRVELMALTIKEERTGSLKLPGRPQQKGVFETLIPTRAIMIFFAPLPLPRNPMPTDEVKVKLSQPFIWPDGRTAQMRFGHNKEMTADELSVINRNSESPSAPQELKIGLLPIFIELTRDPSRRAA